MSMPPESSSGPMRGRITVNATTPGLDVYDLIKFQRSNQNTCITQTPVVRIGEAGQKEPGPRGWACD